MTETQTTPLEDLISQTRAFYARVKDGAQASASLTNATLANFVLNTLLPLVEALRKEYNEGFDVVQSVLSEEDDDEDGNDDELLVVAKNLVGKLAVFGTVVLKHTNLLDENGNLLDSVPAEIRTMYDQLIQEIATFEQATQPAGEEDEPEGGAE